MGDKAPDKPTTPAAAPVAPAAAPEAAAVEPKAAPAEAPNAPTPAEGAAVVDAAKATTDAAPKLQADAPKDGPAAPADTAKAAPATPLTVGSVVADEHKAVENTKEKAASLTDAINNLLNGDGLKELKALWADIKKSIFGGLTGIGADAAKKPEAGGADASKDAPIEVMPTSKMFEGIPKILAQKYNETNHVLPIKVEPNKQLKMPGEGTATYDEKTKTLTISGKKNAKEQYSFTPVEPDQVPNAITSAKNPVALKSGAEIFTTKDVFVNVGAKNKDGKDVDPTNFTPFS